MEIPFTSIITGKVRDESRTRILTLAFLPPVQGKRG
jgi:hypothetical protein